jgi:DNA-nicking Smr family endonuclease
MKIPVGTAVVILESGETGVIAYYDGNTAFIDVDGDAVQAHAKDIEPVASFGKAPVKTTTTDTPKQFDSIEEGLLIQFAAVRNMAGELTRFDLSLVNNTPSHILFEYQFHVFDASPITIRKELNSAGTIKLHEFKTDQLNDAPLFIVNCWLKTAEGGTKPAVTKEIKLKAKQYFAKIDSPEFKKQDKFVLEVTKEIEPKIKKTPLVTKDNDDFFFEKKKIPAQHELIIKAEMPDFIDLHAENLLPGYQHMDANDILYRQISHFKNFLEKAIKYNLHKIYVVHGIGKGVLKSEIEKVLKKYPEVSSYNNDYHVRFGFGATEIFLD